MSSEGSAKRAHFLKTWQQAFEAVISWQKLYEVRKNDRDFRVGDFVVLREFDEASNLYTGRSYHAKITYLTPGGSFGLPEDLCVFGFARAGAICHSDYFIEGTVEDIREHVENVRKEIRG